MNIGGKTKEVETRCAWLLFLVMAVIMICSSATVFAEDPNDDTSAGDPPIVFNYEELELDMSDYCNYFDKDDYDSDVYYTLKLSSGEAAFFSTSNDDVAITKKMTGSSVKVQLLKPGTVKIRAHNEDGNSVAVCTLNITASIKDIEIKVYRDDEYDYYDDEPVIAPGKELHLKAYSHPSFAPEPEVTWASSNNEYATVDENGLVTLHKRGPVSIIAETTDGIPGSYSIKWSDTVTSGDYTYKVLDGNEAEIISYDGDDKEIVIPDTLDGYTVSSIGYNSDWDYYSGKGVFEDCDQLRKVTVPATIKTIGARAFSSCDRLQTVILNCDADIPAGCFSSCRYLKEVQINGNPEKIGKCAFDSCNSLESIDLPDSIVEIGEKAFMYSRVESIQLPSGLKKIEAGIFKDSSVSTIKLPVGLKEIGKEAFRSCSNLVSISLPEGLEEIGEEAFANTGLKSIQLPNSLKGLDHNAFDGTSIGTLKIGDNVEYVGVAGGVKSFSVSAANPNFSSKGGALYDKSGKTFLRCPDVKYHFSVPSGTETIAENAFSGISLYQLDFPETLKTIERNALPDSYVKWWEGRTEIVFPKSLQTVGENNINSGEYFKLYYRGSADNWKAINIEYYNNNALTQNSSIIYNHKKTGINIAKTSVNCTYAERPKLKITYNDGSNIKYNDVRVCNNSTDYVSCNEEGTVRYAEIRPYMIKGSFKACIIAGGCAKDITVNVTGPTPISKASISGLEAQEYTGKAIKPYFTAKFGNIYLYSGDYTVKYQNNTNVGTATVIITGKNEFTGTLKKTFKILPKETWFTSCSPGKKSVTLKWKKIGKQATGYQIQYGLKKNFKGAKTVTIKNYKTTKRKISKLKSNKLYYFRIRTYKKVGKKTYYSKWSGYWATSPQ